MIDLYRELTGIDIQSASENQWECTIGGRQGEYSFELNFDPSEDQYSYRPLIEDQSPVWTKLPTYLKEEISFDRDQIQLFFWRALNFLMTK